MSIETKKKILYVITKSNWGGAQRHVFDLATNFSKKGHLVTVALGGEGTLKKRLEEAGVETIPLPFLERDINLLKEIRVFFLLLKLYRQEQPSVIHLHSSKIGGLGTLAGRIHNLLSFLSSLLTANRSTLPSRIIFTAHGWPFEEKFRGPLARAAIKFLSWLTVVFSHSTICVSESDRQLMLHMPFVKNKLVTIHNGIDTPSLLSKNEARDRLKNKMSPSVSDDHIWIGSIGELHKNKGFLDLIEATASLSLAPPKGGFAIGRKLATVVVGEGEERQNLTKLIEHHELQDSFFLPGHIESAASYISAFDCFVISSHKEGFPYALLEAAHAGVPIVATNVGGIRELFSNHDESNLIEAENPSALAHRLADMMQSLESAKANAERLRERVIDEFNVDSMVARVSEVYYT